MSKKEKISMVKKLLESAHLKSGDKFEYDTKNGKVVIRVYPLDTDKNTGTKRKNPNLSLLEELDIIAAGISGKFDSARDIRKMREERTR